MEGKLLCIAQTHTEDMQAVEEWRCFEEDGFAHHEQGNLVSSLKGTIPLPLFATSSNCLAVGHVRSVAYG